MWRTSLKSSGVGMKTFLPEVELRLSLGASARSVKVSLSCSLRIPLSHKAVPCITSPPHRNIYPVVWRGHKLPQTTCRNRLLQAHFLSYPVWIMFREQSQRKPLFNNFEADSCQIMKKRGLNLVLILCTILAQAGPKGDLLTTFTCMILKVNIKTSH